MRPKLRGDTKYVPTPEGVFLQNNRRVLRIPGKQVYQWVDKLAPYLDGGHSLEELTDGLSAERAQMVDQLVDMLAAAGFVKDVAADRAHTLSPAETEAFAPEIAFIDYFCDSAPARFEEFRHSRVVAIGSGQTVTALVAAQLAVGLREVTVLVTGECPTDPDRWQQRLQTARQRDPEQTLTVQRIDGDEAALRAALRPFDAVLHVSDRPMLARAAMLDRVCRAEGMVLLQAVLVGDQAWIGPLSSPDGDHHGGWDSAWRRLQATRTGPVAERGRFAFTDGPTVPVSQYVTSTTAALVANHASFELFKHLAGIPVPEVRGQLLRVDLATLRTSVHRFSPHPASVPVAAAPHPDALTETIEGLSQREPIDEQDFSQHVRERFDEQLGLFTDLDEGELQQLPLNVCRVTISNPSLLPEPDEPLTAVGVGTDIGMARRRAAQRACELYAASAVDERRLVQANGQRAEVWGYDLLERRPRLVPAAQVFPTLRGVMPSLDSAPSLASGFSWAQTLTTALAAVCQQLTVAGLDLDGEPFPMVDLDAGVLDEPGARYLRILRTWDVPVAVYEVTGTLGVPCFAFCAGERTVAYRAGVDVRDVLRGGLEQVIAHEQERTNRQPDYAPPGVADLPRRVRGMRLTRPEPSTAGDWVDPQQRLCGALAQHGHRVVVVPLDHDQALTEVLPYIVTLVVEPGVAA